MGLRIMGVFAIIPATVLLTVSFFVMFLKRKIEAGSLKVFGYIVVILLWISAALILGCGIYTMITGQCPMIQMMQAMKAEMYVPQIPWEIEFPMQQPMMR